MFAITCVLKGPEGSTDLSEKPPISVIPLTFGACPNVLGSSDVACESSKNAQPSGAFASIISTIFMQSSSSSFNIEVPNIDASRCSSIYGASNKVQPKAMQLLIIIKA